MQTVFLSSWKASKLKWISREYNKTIHEEIKRSSCFYSDKQMVVFMVPQSWRKEDSEEEPPSPNFHSSFLGEEVEWATVVLCGRKVGVSFSLAAVQSMGVGQKWLTTAFAKMIRGVSYWLHIRLQDLLKVSYRFLLEIETFSRPCPNSIVSLHFHWVKYLLTSVPFKSLKS